MKKLISFIFLFVCLTSIAQNKTNFKKGNPRPTYAGHLEYTQGNFDSYNYPVKGDSVLVSTTDSATISITIFAGKNLSMPRPLNIDFTHLTLIKKKRFEDIVAPDKIVATNNYDVKFSNEVSLNKDNYVCRINLTHYSNGDDADLILIEEDGGLEVYNMFVANLRRINP